jgi:uncharacterized lipoprotein YajG
MMKVYKKLLFLTGFLLLGACAAGEYPGAITNGMVGDENSRIEASTSHKTILFIFSADGSSDPALAKRVNNKLAKMCSGGKLENVTMDLSRKEVWLLAEKETLKATANCIKPTSPENK